MKILIGGSPCTHWSIAQTKNRETEASGIGWELFLNYRIARDKYQPDFFLYENNKSMSPAIRAQITAELGVEPVLINSALVSAQNRQRLYWVGRRNPDGTYSQVAVEQPVDRGILLRDILESGVCWKEKGYALLSTTGGTTVDDMVSRHQRNGAAEPVAIKPLTEKEMDYMVRETKDGRNHFDFDYFHDATQEKSACVTANTHKGVPYNVLVEPVRIGTIENDAKNQTFDSQQYRVYSPDAKSVTLCGNGGGLGAKTGLYAVPVDGRVVGRRINEQGHRDDYNEEIERIQRFEVNEDPNKTNCLSTVEKDNMIAVPVRVGAMPNKDGELGTSQSRRIYSTDGKSVSLQARPNGGGADGAATGLYAVPVIPDGKGQFVIKAAGGKEIPVYEVRGGRITIKGKTYPIKLAAGFCPPGRRVVFAPGYYMEQIQLYAGERPGSLHQEPRIYFSTFQIGTLLFRRGGDQRTRYINQGQRQDVPRRRCLHRRAGTRQQRPGGAREPREPRKPDGPPEQAGRVDRKHKRLSRRPFCRVS